MQSQAELHPSHQHPGEEARKTVSLLPGPTDVPQNHPKELHNNEIQVSEDSCEFHNNLSKWISCFTELFFSM